MITEQAMEQMEQLTMEMEKLLASVIIQRDKAVAALRGGQGIVFDDGYEVNVAALRKQVADLDAQLSEAVAALRDGLWLVEVIHVGTGKGGSVYRTRAEAFKANARDVLARPGADDE